MTLKQLLSRYALLHYWWNGLYNAVWRELSSLPNTDAQVERKRKIENLLFQIKELIEQSFGPEIGKKTMADIRTKI